MIFETKAIFVCDALTLLERLPSSTVTLAYVDPPWDAQPATGRYGTEPIDNPCIEFLSKVVQQVHRLLTNNGSLFVHWSAVSQCDMRLIANQVFGEQPKYEIIWHKKGALHQSRSGPKVDNELILVYGKSNDFIYNPVVRPLSSEEVSRYAQKDKRGVYRMVDLTVPSERSGACFIWRGYELPPQRSWRFTQSKLEALAQEELIHFPVSTGLPRLKQYLNENASVELGTTWNDIPFLVRGRERTGYPCQRPHVLMERIIKLASNKKDLVLDPFFGPGTALVAAQSLGRQWWGADNSTEAHQITVMRLLEVCGLKAERDFAVFKEADVIKHPIVHATYKGVIESVSGIAKLQQDMDSLNNHLLSLRKSMNIGENDDEQQVEEVIKRMENWISMTTANQLASVDAYISIVCSWLTGWERLDKASQSFLPQAERNVSMKMRHGV